MDSKPTVVDQEARSSRVNRRQKQHDFARAHILEAAAKLVSSGSIEELKMEDLAQEAGYSVGSLYYYFKNKDELAFELFTVKMGEIREAMEQAPPDGLEVQEVLVWRISQSLLKLKDSSAVIIDLAGRVHRTLAQSCENDAPLLHSLILEQQEYLGRLVVSTLGQRKMAISESDAGCAFEGLLRAFIAREFLINKYPEIDAEGLARKVVEIFWHGAGIEPE